MAILSYQLDYICDRFFLIWSFEMVRLIYFQGYLLVAAYLKGIVEESAVSGSFLHWDSGVDLTPAETPSLVDWTNYWILGLSTGREPLLE